MSKKPSDTIEITKPFRYNHYEEYAHLLTTAAEIKQLCGLDLDQLRKLLAAGAEIKMPERRYTYFPTEQEEVQNELLRITARYPLAPSGRVSAEETLLKIIKAQSEIYRRHCMGVWTGIGEGQNDKP